MSSRFQNIIEIVNEIFTLSSNYFIIMFTDFVPDVEFRYKKGFDVAGAILFVIFINVLVVFLDLGLGLRLEYMKKKHANAWKKYD
jgi:hypothetical protein